MEMCASYLIKSDNCLKASKILLKAGLYENSIGEAYYAMYNATLSLLFKCGIKCENHTGSILLLNILFKLEMLHNILSNAKTERIDKQYYIMDAHAILDSKETSDRMIKEAESFILELRNYSNRLTNDNIKKVRESFATL